MWWETFFHKSFICPRNNESYVCLKKNLFPSEKLMTFKRIIHSSLLYARTFLSNSINFHLCVTYLGLDGNMRDLGIARQAIYHENLPSLAL